ncbi:MAG: hypothetical protein AB7F32_11325 [Victivallaceae bacterium]
MEEQNTVLASTEKPPEPGSQINPAGELDIRKIGQWFWQGNPFYLVSAALALYASTILFNTENIWMETAVPVAILAGYTALCAATVTFIVRRGQVWDDARSLLFIILALPLALSASLDDKVIDRPEVSTVWMAGSLAVVGVLIHLSKKGLGIHFSRGTEWTSSLLLGLFFFYPLILSQLLRSNPALPERAIRGIALFPLAVAVLLMPLLRQIRDGKLWQENGTPWPRITEWLFGIFIFAAMIRTYLFCISFYGGRGVGGYRQMETGFGIWLLMPIFVAVLMLAIELSLRTGKRPLWWLFLICGTALMLIISPAPQISLSRAELVFFVAVWGGASRFLPFWLGTAILWSYLSWRREHKAWLFAALSWIMALHLVTDFGKVFRDLSSGNLRLAGAVCAILAVVALALLAYRVRRVETLLLFLLVLFGGGTIYAHHCQSLPRFPYLLMLALNAALLVAAYVYRNRKLEIAGLSLITILMLPAVIWCAKDPALLEGVYIIVILGGTALFWRHGFRAPLVVQMLMLLVWLVWVVTVKLNALPWRGAGVIFVSLVFFATAFAISAIKGGIWKKKP